MNLNSKTNIPVLRWEKEKHFWGRRRSFLPVFKFCCPNFKNNENDEYLKVNLGACKAQKLQIETE